MGQSQDIFNGGAGTDTLVGTGGADAILLDDTRSSARSPVRACPGSRSSTPAPATTWST